MLKTQKWPQDCSTSTTSACHGVNSTPKRIWESFWSPRHSPWSLHTRPHPTSSSRCRVVGPSGCRPTWSKESAQEACCNSLPYSVKAVLKSCEGVVVPSVAVAVDSHLADWKNVVASQTGGAPVVRPFHPSAVSPQVITWGEATMGWQKENVCGTEKRPQLC